MKLCPDCGQEKATSDFYRNSATSGGFQSYCKPCFNTRQRAYYERNKERTNRRTATNYRTRVLAKGGRTTEPEACEACGAGPADPRNGRHQNGPRGLAFDHDHGSGEFRGWLCHKCNAALGLLDDDPNLIRQLLRYLERSNATA